MPPRHRAPLLGAVLLLTPSRRAARRGRRSSPALAMILATLILAACGRDRPAETLVIGGIPDQDFALLEARFNRIAALVSEELGVPVRYAPASDYATLVTAFEHGDVQLAWFGGLTGIQARRAAPGARAIVHRPRDAEFRSVFVARAELAAESLGDLAGRSFTFGSESSTSGHLMPRHFLEEAGIVPEEAFAALNYSGSHDATWQLVADGVWDAGVLNEAVWGRALREAAVDTTRIRVVEVSPPYFDYHWMAHPALDDRWGEGTIERVVGLFLGLSEREDARDVLQMFETDRFVRTSNENYDLLEAVAARLGLLGEG